MEFLERKMNMVGCNDHEGCKRSALAAAEAFCLENKLHLTKTRRRVLELLLEQHKALGAYAILKKLTEEGLGSQPVTAYRALNFLLKHGFAHKVEKLNAFVACIHPQEAHTPAFMICSNCSSVAEVQIPSPQEVLDKAHQSTGFKIERTIVEAVGVCPSCVEEGIA